MTDERSTPRTERPPAPLRLRSTAYVFFEDAGEASWGARLAGAEVFVAMLWGAGLLGFVVALLVVPHVPRAASAAIIGLEIASIAGAISLSAAWARGHRTPALTRDRLLLEGPLGDREVRLADVARVEIGVLSAREPPVSRVTVVRRDGGRVLLDLGRDDALLLCRAIQRRLFGDGHPPAPYDVELRMLDRARAPVAAWAERLRERFAKRGYRHAAGIAEDELDRAIHDAALPAARRVGAALAVCAAGGDEGRERVLRVAERLETPALRIAVERAAEGTLDEAAMGAAEAEDAAIGRGA
jgi:hypothetical protein